MNFRKVSRFISMSFAAGIFVFANPYSYTQVLYSESFDSEATAKVTVLSDEFCFVDYIDYSAFTNGDSETIEIEEAPNQIAGSAATRGVMLRCNVESDDNFGMAGAINLLLADENEGSQRQFDANYRLTFDVWMNHDEFTTRTSSGTTESVSWGVGGTGEIIQARPYRNDGASSGSWGWLAGEGGYTTEDSVVWLANSQQESKNDGGGVDPLFEEAFPEAFPIQAAPANSWAQIKVEVRNGTVTVFYNDVEFHSFQSNETEGGAFVGYEDPFNSLSWSPDYQFAIIDNVVVEQIGSSTIVVTAEQPIGTVIDEKGMTGIWDIGNENNADLVVSEAMITGTNAADFSVITELPITIESGNSAKLEVLFQPAEPNGDKEAKMTLLSNDPTEPMLEIALTGKRAIAEPLMAHFKYDDPEGSATAADASGNEALGTFTAGPDDPLGYEQPSLIGGAGSSIEFSAATAPGVGNFSQLVPLHTPTVSVSMWVKPHEIIGEHTLFNRDPLFDGADAIYGAIILGDGSLQFKSGGEPVAETEADVFAENDTHHVVVTHLDEDGFGNDTAKRSRIYVDGVLLAEAVDDDTKGFDEYPANARTTSMFIASKAAAGFGFTGNIDDIQLYSIELTPEQVAAMFNNPGATAFEAPPSASFAITEVRFDAESGNASITWNSGLGETYLLESSTNLTQWDEVEDGITSGGEMTTYVDMGIPDGTEVRYYRVQLEE